MSARLTCPDGGTCHHECEARCFRVGTCEPLTAFGRDWPEAVRALHAPGQPAEKRSETVSIIVEDGETRIRYRRDADGGWEFDVEGRAGWLPIPHREQPQQILWELAAYVLRDEAIVGGRIGEVDAEVVEEPGDGGT